LQRTALRARKIVPFLKRGLGPTGFSISNAPPLKRSTLGRSQAIPCINAKAVQPYYTSDLWLLALCRSTCGTIAARVVVTSHDALLPSTYQG